MTNQPDHPLFGELVRAWRERAGLTQEALAALMEATAAALTDADPYTIYSGVTREQIGRWEKGKQKHPERNSVKVLAYALADALQQAGYRADAEQLRKRLVMALEPQIPAKTVSWHAAHVDGLMSLFPEEEAYAKWQGIRAWIEAELEARSDLKPKRPNATS